MFAKFSIIKSMGQSVPIYREIVPKITVFTKGVRFVQLGHSYEAARDNMRYPAFWRVTDNACEPHFHSALELVYVKSGSLSVALNGTKAVVRQGQLLVVPSYTVHTYSTPQASQALLLLVPLDYISTFQKISGTRRFKNTVLEAPDAEDIAACLELLLQEPVPADKDSFVVRGFVYIVLGRLLQRVPMEAIPKDSDHPDICKVLAYVTQNFQKPITLSGLAAEFGYSANRLSHIFNKNVGCGLPEYINILRARQAAKLMLEGSASVTEAAMISGFESMRTFYRSFNMCFGMTPSEYITQCG